MRKGGRSTLCHYLHQQGHLGDRFLRDRLRGARYCVGQSHSQAVKWSTSWLVMASSWASASSQVGDSSGG